MAESTSAVPDVNQEQQVKVELGIDPVTQQFKTPNNVPQIADCHFFLTASCNKGDSCIFRHSETVKATPSICSFWMGGFCKNGQQCTFQHPSNPFYSAPAQYAPRGPPPADKSKVPCHFFTTSHCLKGSSCPFLHPGASAPGPDPENVEVNEPPRDLGPTHPFEVSAPPPRAPPPSTSRSPPTSERAIHFGRAAAPEALQTGGRVMQFGRNGALPQAPRQVTESQSKQRISKIVLVAQQEDAEEGELEEDDLRHKLGRQRSSIGSESGRSSSAAVDPDDRWDGGGSWEGNSGLAKARPRVRQILKVQDGPRAPAPLPGAALALRRALGQGGERDQRHRPPQQQQPEQWQRAGPPERRRRVVEGPGAAAPGPGGPARGGDRGGGGDRGRGRDGPPERGGRAAQQGRGARGAEAPQARLGRGLAAGREGPAGARAGAPAAGGARGGGAAAAAAAARAAAGGPGFQVLSFEEIMANKKRKAPSEGGGSDTGSSGRKHQKPPGVPSLQKAEPSLSKKPNGKSKQDGPPPDTANFEILSFEEIMRRKKQGGGGGEQLSKNSTVSAKPSAVHAAIRPAAKRPAPVPPVAAAAPAAAPPPVAAPAPSKPVLESLGCKDLDDELAEFEELIDGI